MTSLRSRSTARRGFTLLEIMVSMALLIVLVGSTFGVLIATNNASQRVYRIANTQETARQALDLLAADLRAAGLGVASGEIGIAPNAQAEYRIPVIYSGPDVVVQQPYGRSTLVTNSIFIVSAEPTTMGISYNMGGMQGVVLDAGTGFPLDVLCGQADGGTIGCNSGSSAIYVDAGVPLLIGDLRNAVVVTPTGIHSSGDLGAQLITYAEQSLASLSTDPKSPYGISSGAMMSRLRVVHWYLKQTDPTAPPRLYRSKPTLTTSGSNACVSTNPPFQDETTNPGSGIAGVEMGAGPIQSMQIRYVFDTNDTNLFNQFQMATSIGQCDSADVANNVVPQAVSKLREVRVQVVSLATQPDLANNVSTVQATYSTPVFEGSVATPDGGTSADGGALADPYPRRAFNVRVVPRALQGTRL